MARLQHSLGGLIENSKEVELSLQEQQRRTIQEQQAVSELAFAYHIFFFFFFFFILIYDFYCRNTKEWKSN